MLLWKTLHILSMVTMVTVFIGVEMFYAAAIWRRDVDKLAWVHRVTERGVGSLAFIGLIAGIAFGILAALDGGFDLMAPWLIAAYALVGLFLVNAALIGRNVFYLGREALEAEDGRATCGGGRTEDRRQPWCVARGHQRGPLRAHHHRHAREALLAEHPPDRVTSRAGRARENRCSGR
jgi:hypothetical protein